MDKNPFLARKSPPPPILLLLSPSSLRMASFNPNVTTLCPTMLQHAPGGSNEERALQVRETARVQRREQVRQTTPDLNANVFPPCSILQIPCPAPTPQAIIGGYHGTPELIRIFPRRRAYTDRPCMTIGFRVRGQPAPYLKDILLGRVQLDDGDEELEVVRREGWRRIRWALDWPGYDLPTQEIKSNEFTRSRIAEKVAGAVRELLRHPPCAPDAPWAGSDWAVDRVFFGDVRLVAINYYPTVWVPVLAFNERT
ncbi:hypothetical protein FB45DRAFT_1037435 [Roridomyces roridus]|uniref:Uncharacterized protein n=1 Tax=Roridomyces roridus TaxID=1738132 RepID=A0AAD7B725_9AGAR|nr:hypothetical protein FB45DRAFT_1037435 [Roridomyces roridus]